MVLSIIQQLSSVKLTKVRLGFSPYDFSIVIKMLATT